MNPPELRPSTKSPAAADTNDDLRTRVQKNTSDEDRLAASGLNMAGLGTGGPSMRESFRGFLPQDTASMKHGEWPLDLERSDPSVNIAGPQTEGAADPTFTNQLERLAKEEKEMALMELFPALKLHDVKSALEKNKGNTELAVDQLMAQSFFEETGRPNGDAFSDTDMPSQPGTKITQANPPQDLSDESLPAFPPNSNRPCNTIYIRNLPLSTPEDEIKALLLERPGFKRLMFRTKENMPICFVEFENVALASEALRFLLSYSTYPMINARLGFSKTPLGVRSGQRTTIAGPSRVPDEMRSGQSTVSSGSSRVPSDTNRQGFIPAEPLAPALPAKHQEAKDERTIRAEIKALNAVEAILADSHASRGIDGKDHSREGPILVGDELIISRRERIIKPGTLVRNEKGKKGTAVDRAPLFDIDGDVTGVNTDSDESDGRMVPSTEASSSTTRVLSSHTQPSVSRPQSQPRSSNRYDGESPLHEEHLGEDPLAGAQNALSANRRNKTSDRSEVAQGAAPVNLGAEALTSVRSRSREIERSLLRARRRSRSSGSDNGLKFKNAIGLAAAGLAAAATAKYVSGRKPGRDDLDRAFTPNRSLSRDRDDSYSSHDDDPHSRRRNKHANLIDPSVSLSETAPGTSVVSDEFAPTHLPLKAALDPERGEEERESKQLRQIEIDEVERRKEAFPVALEGPVPFSIVESGRAKARIRREPDKQEPKAKSRRESRPKVTTGCNNCKNRRVKCDETRPQCNKCVRSGRTCGGYTAYKKWTEFVVPIEERRGGLRPSEYTLDQEREEVLKLLESSASADYKSNAKGVNKTTEGHFSPLDQVSSAIKGDNLTSSSTYPTARNNIEISRGAVQHQHIGGWGRNDPNGPAPIFDDKSPFRNTEKSKAKRSSSDLSGGDMNNEAGDELLHFASQDEIKAEESDNSRFDAGILDTEEDFSSQSVTEPQVDGRQVKRFRLSHQQTRFLMSEFAKQAHPDAAHRERLSKEIPGSSPKHIQVWFQNRRAKIRRLTADDRQRMMAIRTVPDDFDNVQALHSPYGAIHGLPMQSPVDFIPGYNDHLLRPLMVDPFRRNQEANFTMASHDRQDMRPRDFVIDDYSNEDNPFHRSVKRQRSGSGGSPRHKSNLAEDALAGAGASALLATKRDRDPEQKSRETSEVSPSSGPVHPISQQITSTNIFSNTPGDRTIFPSSFPTNNPAKGPNEVYSNMQDALDTSKNGPNTFLGIQASPPKGRPTPLTLKEEVVKGDISSVCQLLEEHFNDVAKGDFDWLHELLDIDCSCEEMAKLLIDGDSNSPWVLLDEPVTVKAHRISGFHQNNCVHHGGYEVTNNPQLTQSSPIPHSATKAKELVSQYCGLAGVVSPDGINSQREISLIQFDKGNSIAAINYKDDWYGIRTSTSQMLKDLERIFHAIGFLQEQGLCCDSITILRITDTLGPIELCKVDISLLKSFYDVMERWGENVGDFRLANSCKLEAFRILEIFIGENRIIHINSEDYLSLVMQCMNIAILSYIQAHIGSLHPPYLVSGLREIRLFGIEAGPGSHHVVVELLDFTCMRDMVKDSALVFRSSGISPSTFLTRFDLWASPEDIADTWGPARFITDSIMGPSALHGIEIGGGTIFRPTDNSNHLHWTNGPTLGGGLGLVFHSTEKTLIAGIAINAQCPLDETKSWRHPATNAYLKHLGTQDCRWELREKQTGFQGGQYAVLAFNATYIKQNGVTLKQQQLMLPFNEIDLAFLNSTCGLQISFCTGVARRVALRELLADVMVPFVESRLQKPVHWKDLKTKHNIVQNFRTGELEQWFNNLSLEMRGCAIQIVRSMLEVLKDTGIDKNGEELVIAWVRKESPYSSLRLRCEKTSLWARILADSEDCATFACITPLCLQSEKHKCRHLDAAPWHNVSNLLDTAVCPQLSNRELTTVATTLAPFKLQHQVSYWIGKSGSNMIAKVWITTEDAEPVLVVRQKVIPEKYRARMPKSMVERLGRLRERQASETIAKQVMILTEMPI